MATAINWGTEYHLSQFDKLSAPDKTTLKMAEVLNENNSILQDLPVYPSNDVLSDTDARRSSIPTPQIVDVGEAWTTSVSLWTNFVEVVSIFRDSASFEESMLMLTGDPVTKRMQALKGHYEGFSQGVANHIFHGTSVASPKKFDGFDVRYSIPDAVSEVNPSSAGDYGVYDAGGTGSATTSLWLFQLGAEKICGLHPKNHARLGLESKDAGKVCIWVTATTHRWDYLEEMSWMIGLKVKDFRAGARIRNVPTAISGDTAATQDLIRIIIKARNRFKGNDPVFMYCSPGGFDALDILAVEKSNVKYSSDNVWGRPLLMVRDIVIRQNDCILDTETAVAAA